MHGGERRPLCPEAAQRAATGQACRPESPGKSGFTLCEASHGHTVGTRVLTLPAEAKRAVTPLAGNAGAGPLQGSSLALSHMHPGPAQPELSERAPTKAGPPAGAGRLSQAHVCPGLLSNNAAGGTELSPTTLKPPQVGIPRTYQPGQWEKTESAQKDSVPGRHTVPSSTLTTSTA